MSSKTYSNKIKKNNISRKKIVNPFPIPNLIIINKKNNIVNNKKINGGKNGKDNNNYSLKNLFNYYLNEFFPASILYYFSPIKGNLMVLSNNSIFDKNSNSNGEIINQVSCVIISDKKSIKTCWNNGFYGKGNLSRSEPNWTERIIKDIIKKNFNANNKNSNNTSNINKFNTNMDKVGMDNSLLISKLVEIKSLTLKMSKYIVYKNLLLY